MLPKVDLENTDPHTLKRLLDGPRLAHQLFLAMPGNLPLNQLSHKHRSNSPANSVFLKWRMQLHLFSGRKKKKTKMKGAQHLRPLRGKGGSWKGPYIFSSHRLPRGSHPRPIYGENLQG